MNVSFRQLRAFILIAETSSFTRTAEQLHLSQPALSYSIRKLEETMGLQLLARNTRSVELTLAGEHFLPQARRMLRDMDDAVRDARDTLSLSRGSLRLAALPTAAASFLPVVIASFQRKHPGVRVSVLDGRAGEIMGWVQRGEVDAGITSLPDDLSGLSFVRLLDDNLVLLTHKDHQRDSLDDWKRRPYIALTPDTSIRPLADAALRYLNVEPEPAWEVAHMSTATALVREGLGFSLLPASCTAVFNIGEQCEVIAIDQPGKRSIGLLQRKPVAQSPSLSQFMQHLRQTLRQQ
ncbi:MULTISPECIES: LysR family transcriptional regulator [Pseudomonas]|jgi:DNA-binding transcriptional LysR family regulator|uniref:LysR family transcriptional regulator n=1 Tax=Pseudomonas TaxID=286 RepID=UPI0009538355|nr:MULTISPECIES: LysR family transcriptional regulator [unclassified Pseudomonas]MBD0701800.1 LysR family transcriptional regulator [Pseudomonas sp. PSB1]MDD2030267.1 LysR substrate-binding domain-containing protein [Pseudomonas sp. 39167]MEA1027817.1 LysR substrate-binding domain-containing protein [Pseudomonas sp. N-137]QKJ35952.1 LysR family transcriptional regulator [Pseudomonas sp. MPDS]WNZ75895.1 LysR substrate-binding domain-containing protein [Pseudomonas sp. P105]